MKPKILIVGFGRLGSQLAGIFSHYNLVEVYLAQPVSKEHEQSKHNLEAFPIINTPSCQDGFFDLIFYCVRDHQISEAFLLWNKKSKANIHCSGATSISALKGSAPSGVFYPVQSFSLGVAVNWNGLPICLEADQEPLLSQLEELAKGVGAVAYFVNSDQRLALHTAAVFCNNFPNHMLAIAEKICQENNLEFDWLTPLIHETINKALQRGPNAVQTGPAVRNDVLTMQNHLNALGKHTDWQILYKQLSASIQKFNNQ